MFRLTFSIQKVWNEIDFPDFVFLATGHIVFHWFQTDLLRPSNLLSYNFDVPTKLPDSAYATLMTQAERNGIIWTLFPVHVSQIINLPSKDPDTACLEEESFSVEWHVSSDDLRYIEIDQSISTRYFIRNCSNRFYHMPRGKWTSIRDMCGISLESFQVSVACHPWMLH